MADSNITIGDDGTKVPALMQKIATLEQEKTELVNENQVINEKIEKLKTEIETSKAENEALKSETKAMDSISGRAAHLDNEVSRLQRDLISSMSRVEEANAELTEAKRVIEGLRKSDLQKSKVLEAVEKERNLLLEKIKKDGEGVKESHNRIRDLEKKIEALEIRDKGYKTEKLRVEEELRLKIEERDGQIRDMENVVEELHDVMERSNKERDELEIVKNELEALLKKSERRAKEMENKMGVLHKELEGSEKMISGLKEKASDSIKGNLGMDSSILDDEENGFLGLKLDWSVVAASACSIALVAVVYLRYTRQR